MTPLDTPALTMPLVAEGNVFKPGELTVVAEAPFAIRLENRDAVPHNVAILAAPKLAGDVFSGPAERTNTFPALPAGNYTFLCEVHPEMKGTLVSR